MFIDVFSLTSVKIISLYLFLGYDRHILGGTAMTLTVVVTTGEMYLILSGRLLTS